MFAYPVLAGAALALGLAVVIMLLLLVRPNTKQVPMSRRRPAGYQRRSPVAGIAEAATRGVDRVIASRSLTVAERLDVAGIATPAAHLIVILISAMMAALAFSLLIGQALLGIALVVLIPLASGLVVSIRTDQRRNAFALQLDETSQMLAGSLRAGYSFPQAMAMVGREAASPTSEEFTRISNELRVGRSLAESMQHTARRMRSDDFSWISQAVAINREVGGNLADVLDGVAHTIRERAQLRRQVQSLSAEGRLSALVLIALPFGLVGLLLVVNPTYIQPLFTSPLGWAMLAVAIILLIVGSLWLRKTVQIRF